MAYRSILFYASATLFAATIPKHLHVGLHKIAPATKSIAQTEANKKVRNLITPTWLHSAVYLAMSALLNIKWARCNGPQSSEETAIVWIQLLSGIATGLSYFNNAMYAGLPMLWGANVMTAIAALLA